MNYWFWLLIILIPVIVFSMKPEANLWLRLGRLMIAAPLCYGLMFWTVYWQAGAEIEVINAFVDKFPECADQQCADAPRPTLDGPILGFFLILGWIPATGYVGLWELLWRLHYRSVIREMGKTFKGKWASNALITFAFIAAYPTWIFLATLAVKRSIRFGSG